MKGAQALMRTLVTSGVEVCFTNPGTSEMQFVAALDEVPEMRAVLALFEGVATGAADGYGRVTGRPAATLLHLGPGLGNGIANLHNARRARTPIVNIVGDHATDHLHLDPPLASDIESLARPVSVWFRQSAAARSLATDAAEAVSAAYGPPCGVATLVAPADLSWTEVDAPAAPAARRAREVAGGDSVEGAAKALASGEPAGILLGGTALRERGVLAAGRVARATGAKLLCETLPARIERGGGLPEIERLPYLAELAIAALGGLKHLVLVDAGAPVSFFAYPNLPGYLVPGDCEVHVLAEASADAPGSLEALAEALGADRAGAEGHAGGGAGGGSGSPTPQRPGRPSGALTAESVAAAVGALLPQGAIVSDEANTSSVFLPAATAGAPRHDWLCLSGGAIGQGMPVATGAAVGCPDRRVINLESDGSAMYTLQALWTQAREGLDVTTVVLNNHSYAILKWELSRVGAGQAGPRASAMLELDHPDLDFVALARGMGVPATRATDAEQFTAQLERALAEPGPSLVEAMLQH
ncbi:MAG TPA: acetolactate synthase large subunit [Acidimicrobiales bacterium]|nr:acetolactate synthase large subunit [Acidimicrobiales bacterium]